MRALEDEGRRVTTFLAMLGHELRNPLAPISNAVSIMQLEPIESERLRMCRDVIARQLHQMTRLVDDLLDVGRITAGKIHLDLQPVELGSVLREALESIEPFARSRAQALTLDVSAAPAWVAGDRTRLLQIANNLLGNATKFTQRNGRISAALRRSGAYVEFSVVDNGPGIAPHRLRDIFHMFVQGEQDSARTQGGLGLGLSLVQQLVTLHGGEVSAYSGGLGKGAEFIVRLPLVKAPVEEVPASVDALIAHTRCVLVVDDNRDAAVTLAALLQQLGYRTQVAYEAHAALESMRASRPDLAILDIGLPQIDGMALAQLIRAEFGRSLPLIALTGYGQESDRDAAFDAGFTEYLTKPLAPEALFAALGRIFPDEVSDA